MPVLPHISSSKFSFRIFSPALGIPRTHETLVVRGILLVGCPEADSQSDSSTVRCQRSINLIEEPPAGSLSSPDRFRFPLGSQKERSIVIPSKARGLLSSTTSGLLQDF